MTAQSHLTDYSFLRLRARDDSEVPGDVKRWLDLCTATGLYSDHQRLPPHFAATVPHLFTSNPLPRDLSSASTPLSATPSMRPTLYPVNFSSLIKFSPTSGRRNLAAPAFHFMSIPEPTECNANQMNAEKASLKPTPGVIGPSRLELAYRGHIDSDNEVSEVLG